jgi:hypothetical protein
VRQRRGYGGHPGRLPGTATKEIANGVTARVVRDTVSPDGEVVEDTRDWYAQDSGGTVWYLGEDTAEFDDGEVTTRAGSFEAGVNGAKAGVIMPGDPAVGMAYRQEYYVGEAEDNGVVLSLQAMADVPARALRRPGGVGRGRPRGRHHAPRRALRVGRPALLRRDGQTGPRQAGGPRRTRRA